MRPDQSGKYSGMLDLKKVADVPQFDEANRARRHLKREYFPQFTLTNELQKGAKYCTITEPVAIDRHCVREMQSTRFQSAQDEG